MDLGSLLGTVVKESLGMRSKRHDAVTSWLLKGVKKRPGLAIGAAVGAAGLAYGLWERSQRAPGVPGVGAPPPPLPPQPGPPRAAAVPPPLPATPAAHEPAVSLRQVRLVLAAAQADGAVTPAEMQRVMDAARAAGAEAAVLQDLATPRDVEAIVDGVTDDAERRDLYALAFAVVRCDETVGDAERRWLERLAAALRLAPADAAALEAEVAAAIDAG